MKNFGILFLMAITVSLVYPRHSRAADEPNLGGVVCASEWDCAALVGMQREIDARGVVVSAQDNADHVCMTSGHGNVVDFKTTTHGTSCGCGYGLANWTQWKQGDSWQWWDWMSPCLCGSDVTVISQVSCTQ